MSISNRRTLWSRIFPCFVTFLAATILVPFPQDSVLVGSAPASAAKRRNRRSSKKRAIRQEGKLAPRQEITLDDQVTKTKDLKPAEQAKDRPTLDASALQRAEIEALLDEKLDEEIQLARQLLEYETTCEGRSPIEFRLADLYWEKSKRAFFSANDFGLAASERKRAGQEMKSLQNRSIKHYQDIVDSCPDYSEYPKVLYYLGKALVELDRARQGAQYFKRIIQDHGDTEWVANAWFMIGEFYFNSENDAPKALKAYKKAAEFPRSPIYGFAVYKQGWCYINTGDWDLALARFRRVVTISDDPGQDLDKKARFGLRKEALKDYVRSYSHVGDARRAIADFTQVGGQKSVPRMMENLGGWYINRDSHREVALVYRDLIKKYPRSTRLPIFQGRIVDAASKLGDDRATVEQVKKLTKYFRAVRKRVEEGDLGGRKKESVVKDIREAEDIAENTLRKLALEYHKEAKKLRGKARDKNYQYAYELYKHYLKVFPEPKPDADVNYVFFMRYYFAEVLYQLEKFRDAATNYDLVVEMKPRPKDEREKSIVLRAAEDSVRAYDELVQDLDRKSPPVISGTEPKKIPDIKEKLIFACRRYIDYFGTEGDKTVEIRYKMARIYYTYNHFDRAAPAFNDIVDNHPGHEVACYAANLALDIYNGQKNYKALRKATRSYLRNKKLVGEKGACGPQDREKFARIEEQATFFLIKTELEDKKKYLAAGNAYMNFYRQYKNSKYSIDAVYNAAVNYDLGNRLNKANEVREFLVKTFDPDNKLVVETAFNIAESFERVVDFKRAAQYYEQFAKTYGRKDKRTKDAIYNAGLYRATLGDYTKARADRDKFLAEYPRDKDAPSVALAICESLEQEAAGLKKKGKPSRAKWEEAALCYSRWVKNSTYREDVDSLCYSEFRRGEIMRLHTQYARGAGEQKKLLLKRWPSWKKKGLAKVPRCADAVAQLKFRDLKVAYKKYSDLRISELNPTKKQKFDASIAGKVKIRDQLIQGYTSIVEIGVAEWALASLYMIGEGYRNSIEQLLKAPIPNKVPGYTLTADDKTMLRNQLAEMAAPIEVLAVDAYRLCVDKANELGVYNRWSVRALEQLQRLRPQEYPPVVEETVRLAFEEPFQVAKNGLVIEDGERVRSLSLTLKEGIGPPSRGEDPDKNKKNKKKKIRGVTKKKSGQKTSMIPEGATP